ncbi:MAG: class I SAM-dependent methyltransferase [Burkholderiales bacterium]|nr:class I SAM-dependent methyltransferase [Anaerolineae bacterium]
MDEATIRRLNDINREFYRITAADFDQTRQRAWPGWECLLPYLDVSSQALSVLDVGCGNGRFGVFLAENIGAKIHYHGIDNNAALLSRAQHSLAALPNVFATFEERDIITDTPTGQYDLAALFGVLHHVPDFERRKTLLQTLAERVRPGGVLAFACWRFYEEPRWRERMTPWPDDLADKVEAGDYLLDWRRGETALRYCHYVDDAEHAALIAATGLNEVASYRADGTGGASNFYSILSANP